MSFVNTIPAKPPTRNEPSPNINPNIQAELARVGGIVPSSGGRYAGQPIYKLVWGQSEKHFCRGKERVRFIDESLPPLIAQERFYVAPDLFTKCAEWIERRERARVERFLGGDLTVFAEIEPLSNFLKENASSFDYRQLPTATGTRENLNGDFASIASVSVPARWLYLTDIVDVIEIGKACWFVMRWIPPSWHTARRTWENIRYTQNAYVPELNAVVPIVDDLGEYPAGDGFYIPRFQIADFPEDANGNVSPHRWKYAEPAYQNAVAPVIEEIYEQAARSRQEKDRDYISKQRAGEMVETRDREEAASLKRIAERMGVDAPENPAPIFN